MRCLGGETYQGPHSLSGEARIDVAGDLLGRLIDGILDDVIDANACTLEPPGTGQRRVVALGI